MSKANHNNGGKNNNKQQQSKPQQQQPQQKKQPQQKQQQQPQQQQPPPPTKRVVSDQTAHDMHNMLYSQTCCSNCTIQKQTCSFLHVLADEYQASFTTPQPTTSEPYRQPYEQEGKEIDLKKLSFVTKLNHTTLSTNRFILNDLGDTFQKLLTKRTEVLQTRLLNGGLYQQRMQNFEIFSNVALSVKINDPKTGRNWVFQDGFMGKTTIQDIIDEICMGAVLPDLPTLPFYPYGLGLSLSKPSRSGNFNSCHPSMTPYLTKSKKKKATNTPQECIPFFFTLYQCFDHSDYSVDSDSDDDDDDDNNDNKKKNQPLISSKWSYTTKDGVVTLNGCRNPLPIEFDLVYDNVEAFEGTPFYKDLLSPVLSQKRTLKDIFVDRKAYNEEDDDGYDAARKAQDLPRNNEYVEILFQTSNLLQNLTEGLTTPCLTNEEGMMSSVVSNNEEFIAIKQQYEANLQNRMVQLEKLDQTKANFLLSLCLGLRFEIKWMYSYLLKNSNQMSVTLPQQQQQQNVALNKNNNNNNNNKNNNNNNAPNNHPSTTTINTLTKKPMIPPPGPPPASTTVTKPTIPSPAPTTTPLALPLPLATTRAAQLAAKRQANAQHRAAISKKIAATNPKHPYILFAEDIFGNQTEWTGNGKKTNWLDLLQHPTFLASAPECFAPVHTCGGMSEEDMRQFIVGNHFSSGHLIEITPRGANLSVRGDAVYNNPRMDWDTTIGVLRRGLDLRGYDEVDTRSHRPIIKLYPPDDLTTPYPDHLTLRDITPTCQDGAKIALHAQVASQMDPAMKLFVKTLMGKTIVVFMQPQDTTEMLQAVICMREGIPPDQQRIIAGGKQFDLGRTFADYNVQPGAIIHLVLRLRGC